MKNIKKLSRNELKALQGGKDFCTPGNGDICGQYGLSCGINMNMQHGHVVSSNWACM
jgi:hypothetical protein